MKWWEWVFSGIGVLGLGLLIDWLRRRSGSSAQQATVTAQGAKVSNSPVASGTGIVQTVNSPTINVFPPRENEASNDKQSVTPEFYNFDGKSGPIALSGIQHSDQGPWMDVWGLVTIVNPTQSHMKIALHRLVLDGDECAVQGFFFRLKSNRSQKFEHISLMGNAKEDYEVHVLFPDNNYPTPPPRDGELWVLSNNRPEPFPVKVRCPVK